MSKDRRKKRRARAGADPLARAVHAAVEEGTRAADRLRGDVEDVLDALDDVAAQLRPHVEGRGAQDRQVELLRRFLKDLDTLRDKIESLFERQRKRLSEFNVALFGRTGTGKSSLVEALSRGNGARISPGRSDHTRAVSAVEWERCALYDTPGIEGWGRPEGVHGDAQAGKATRARLEAQARDTVEVADVVILAFDTQNQKPGEFAKIAEWVRDLGKPAIAVINSRIPPWRHPRHPHARSIVHRRRYSAAVAGHVRNTRDELGRIGLHGVPIVALSAQRAVFGRAKTPFRGPAGQRVSFEHQRAQYGTDRLVELSNVAALEDLIVAAIERDAVGLRLGMLSEQLRGAATAALTTFAARERHARVLAEELDTSIAELLGVLGLPPTPKSGRPRRGSLGAALGELQELRGGTFDVPVAGELMRHVDRLRDARLKPLRGAALRRASEVVDEALRERKHVSARQRVVNEAAVDEAAQGIVSDAVAYLRSRIALVVRDTSADLRVRLAELDDVDGSAGGSDRAWGVGLEVGGILTSALAVLTTPFYGLGAIIGSLGGWALGRLGRKRRREAEERRERTAQEARRSLRAGVNEMFDDADAAIRKKCGTLAKSARSKTLPPLVENAVALRRFTAETERAREGLAELLDGLPSGGAPAALLREVATGLERSRFPGDRAAAAKLWQGEDWITDPDGLEEDAEPAPEPPLARRNAGAARTAARRRFAASWARAAAHPEPGAGRAWLEQARAVLGREPRAERALAKLERLADEPPKAVFCGDYSAGKSSLIRRLLLEGGEDVPTGLTVAAGPETARVAEFRCGALTLVDTPGFQSGRGGHGERAASAVPDAALVIYVFNPNLLTGSPAALDAALRGDEERGLAGKLGRTLFVINRCDELGVDPAESPGDYEHLCARKRRELTQALRSRDMPISDDDPRVLTVAGDPYGRAGARPDVRRAEFADCADWDGIDRLRDALAAATKTLERNGVDAALLESGEARVTNLLRSVRGDRERLRDRMHELQGLRARVERAIGEAATLEEGLAHGLEQRVADELHALLQRAFVEQGGHRKALADRLESWHEDPAIEDLAREWHRDAVKAIETWAEDTRTGIERRMESPSFRKTNVDGYGLDLRYLKRPRRRGRHSSGQALAAASDVAHRAGDQIVQTATTIADLQTGMMVVNASSKLSFAGAGIGMLELLFDLRQEAARDRRRAEAAAAIHEQAHAYAQLHARGDDDGVGPLAVLSAVSSQLAAESMRIDQELEPLRRTTARLGRRERALERLRADARARRVGVA